MMMAAVCLLGATTAQAQTAKKTQVAKKTTTATKTRTTTTAPSAVKPQEPQKSMIDTLSADSIEKLAYEDNPEACLAMGKIVMKQSQETGDKIDASLKREMACKWYRTAANYGNKAAIQWCSDYYFQRSRGYDPNRDGMNVYGNGFEDDKIESLYYAARFGKNRQAMYEYAKVKEFHKDHVTGQPRQFGEMVKWYKEAAELGDWRSGYEYGKWMISEDPAKAEKYLIKAASMGNGDAAWVLCQAYKTGNNLPQNLKAVPKYLKMAADKGVDDACYWMGMYYMQGYLVPRNYPLAVKYFKKVNGGQYFYRRAPMLYQLRQKGYK